MDDYAVSTVLFVWNRVRIITDSNDSCVNLGLMLSVLVGMEMSPDGDNCDMIFAFKISIYNVF